VSRSGFIFLWTFLDKSFGLRYATPSDRAWIHGGSPTTWFLSTVAVGPFESFYRRVYGLGNRWAKVTGHNTWLR
jgi:thiosulfate dehydrogenase [quinone] large subunit